MMEQCQGQRKCSLCWRNYEEVDFMVNGKNGSICSMCVHICLEILADVGLSSNSHINDDFYLEAIGSPLGPEQRRCLIISPPAKPFNSIVKYHLIKAVTDAGLLANFAEDIYFGSGIAASTWEALMESVIVIADVTGNDANVTYWVGMSLALGKEIIVITQDQKAVPRDLRSKSCIMYKCTTEGYLALGDKLSDSLAKFRQSIISYMPETNNISPERIKNKNRIIKCKKQTIQ
jgi:hypothetical protein